MDTNHPIFNDSINAQKAVDNLKIALNEPNKTFPPIYQQYRDLIKQAWLSANGVFNGQPFLANTEVTKTRIAICNACEFFKKKSKRCTKCGCFMNQKVHLALAKCPIGKWQ